MEKTLAFGVEPANVKYRLRLARYQALGEAVAEFVRTRPPGQPLRLLEVGVGGGRSRRYIEKECGDRGICLRYFGLDLSPRRLDSVYQGDDWQLVKADVEAGIPFLDESFDIVICEQVLEHLNQPAEVLQEIGRILGPGGLLIAGVPTFPPGIAAIRRSVVAKIDAWRGIQRSHVQVFTKGLFAELVEREAGVRARSVRGFRILSGGILRPLENLRGWWRLNRLLGRLFPSLCIEVQVVAVKSAD